MEKIIAGHVLSESGNIMNENISSLRKLFPSVFKEGKIDFKELKEILGDEVEVEEEEYYRFTWAGKTLAKKEANKPSTATLLPSKSESLDWDTTKNIFVEGDNLEVLKLLQKSYASKIKMIYIDPPYNTGKDFVYKDNYKDNLRNYLELTNQVDDEGHLLSTNPETSGRFHSNWLNMMYPRLRLARNLLADDGVIFISIHDVELQNLKKLCEEIFGEDNFLGQITWKARVKPVNIGDAKYKPQKEVEYVLVYQKGRVNSTFLPLLTGGIRSYPHTLNNRKYRTATILKSNRGTNFRSTMTFSINGYTPPEGQRWQAGEDEIKRLFADEYIEFRDGTPFRRYFEDEEGAEHDPFYCFMETEWSSTSEAGKHELNELLGNNHDFDTVKPTRLIKTLIQSTMKKDGSEIVLDFFAGSGTTADAVLQLNSEDSGNRQFICVQFPEPTEEDSGAYASGFTNIAEMTKERIRRVAKKIKGLNSNLDLGFKVFKLNTSNLYTWDASNINIEQTLFNSANNIKEERNAEDILYELLIKNGISLSELIESKDIKGKTVYNIGAGALFVVLDLEITADVAEGIGAWKDQLQPATCQVLFRDSGFTDVEKTNSVQILKRHGISKVNTI